MYIIYTYLIQMYACKSRQRDVMYSLFTGLQGTQCTYAEPSKLVVH